MIAFVIWLWFCALGPNGSLKRPGSSSHSPAEGLPQSSRSVPEAGNAASAAQRQGSHMGTPGTPSYPSASDLRDVVVGGEWGREDGGNNGLGASAGSQSHKQALGAQPGMQGSPERGRQYEGGQYAPGAEGAEMSGWGMVGVAATSGSRGTEVNDDPNVMVDQGGGRPGEDRRSEATEPPISDSELAAAASTAGRADAAELELQPIHSALGPEEQQTVGGLEGGTKRVAAGVVMAAAAAAVISIPQSAADEAEGVDAECKQHVDQPSDSVSPAALKSAIPLPADGAPSMDIDVASGDGVTSMVSEGGAHVSTEGQPLKDSGLPGGSTATYGGGNVGGVLTPSAGLASGAMSPASGWRSPSSRIPNAPGGGSTASPPILSPPAAASQLPSSPSGVTRNPSSLPAPPSLSTPARGGVIVAPLVGGQWVRAPGAGASSPTGGGGLSSGSGGKGSKAAGGPLWRLPSAHPTDLSSQTFLGSPSAEEATVGNRVSSPSHEFSRDLNGYSHTYSRALI